jgi:uncharacterized protein (TIGR02421 family)
MTASLGKALSQAFYAFSHARARYKPAHYHELGRQAMTSAVREVDRKLARVGDNFDLLLHVTPVNAEAAWHALQRHRFNRAPEFHYRPLAFDPGALKRLLYGAPLDTVEDPALHQLFTAKRDELDRQITMLADRGTERFLLGSQQIYGRPGDSLRRAAKEILEQLPPHGRDDRIGDAVDAPVFARLAERELAHYRRSDPDLVARVEVRKDVPGVMVSKGRLLVGHTTKVAKARVAATLHHEVGTHIVTYYNGLKQPFQQFHAGMPGYEEMQEGLAVLSEFLVGGLSRPRLRLLAARVLAVDDVVNGADFIDTFGRLHDDHGFSQRAAYSIAMRVHRGGGFTKDAVYLRGLLKVFDYLAAGGILDSLFVGKLAFEHIDLVEELGWRRVIKPASLRPRYLDDADSRERLSLIRSGARVLDMVREAAR